MKETKEILGNILRMKKSEYELFEPVSSSTTSKSFDKKVTAKPNVLPGEMESIPDNERSLEDMENYNPNQELNFEAEEVKECLEKKKKRRNYIEFRPDYEKS